VDGVIEAETDMLGVVEGVREVEGEAHVMLPLYVKKRGKRKFQEVVLS